MASGEEAKMGSSLKSNHQIKLSLSKSQIHTAEKEEEKEV